LKIVVSNVLPHPNPPLVKGRVRVGYNLRNNGDSITCVYTVAYKGRGGNNESQIPDFSKKSGIWVKSKSFI
jgi:hypothetical protein